MILTLILCHLFAILAANPFHKYPFVFLLDVGNEELEKANSEQIRVSVPGGSVALRYPAIGYGNTIGHVRVSGIDFGTDLKANIVDGGPGYQYVVLVFMGKPGTPYEAVVTVQTVNDNIFTTQNTEYVVNSEPNTNESEEDANNSAEDLSDTKVSNDIQSQYYIQNDKTELMQASSNVYSYVNNEPIDEIEDDDNDDSDDEGSPYNTNEKIEENQGYSDEIGDDSTRQDFEGFSNARDIHAQYINDIEKEDPNTRVKGVDQEDDGDEEIYDDNVNFVADHVINTPVIVDRNYDALQKEIYSQEEFQRNAQPVYQEDPVDYEDPYAEVQINEGAEKYRDANNNNYNIDSDDSYAVAY